MVGGGIKRLHNVQIGIRTTYSAIRPPVRGIVRDSDSNKTNKTNSNNNITSTNNPMHCAHHRATGPQGHRGNKQGATQYHCENQNAGSADFRARKQMCNVDSTCRGGRDGRGRRWGWWMGQGRE